MHIKSYVPMESLLCMNIFLSNHGMLLTILWFIHLYWFCNTYFILLVIKWRSDFVIFLDVLWIYCSVLRGLTSSCKKKKFRNMMQLCISKPLGGFNTHLCFPSFSFMCHYRLDFRSEDINFAIKVVKQWTTPCFSRDRQFFFLHLCKWRV